MANLSIYIVCVVCLWDLSVSQNFKLICLLVSPTCQVCTCFACMVCLSGEILCSGDAGVACLSV